MKNEYPSEKTSLTLCFPFSRFDKIQPHSQKKQPTRDVQGVKWSDVKVPLADEYVLCFKQQCKIEHLVCEFVTIDSEFEFIH